jgi:hypothetical protein
MVWNQLTIFVFISKTDYSKPVKQEVNSTVILPPLVFPALKIVVSPRHYLSLLSRIRPIQVLSSILAGKSGQAERDGKRKSFYLF